MFTFSIALFAQEIDTSEEAEAYEAYLQDLEGLQLHLNKAPESALLELPGLTPDLAWRITAFRPYQNMRDLRRVPGLTPDLLDQISPYLTLTEPPRWQGHLTTRITRPTSSNNQIDHLRLTQRAEIQIGNSISGFILTDRDPKEPNWADYLTTHLQIDHKWGQVILGDVRPEIGQGLLHSRQTRSSASLSTIKPRSQNRIANRNSTEYGAIRGIHLTTQHRLFTLQALYGQVHWDADISPEGVVEIRRTESHVSETTIARKDALNEKLATVHLSAGTPQNHIGATVQQTTFSPAKPQEIATHHFSINARAQGHQTTLFGEIARSHKAQAFVAGLNWQKSVFRLHLLLRKYDPQFSSLHGAPIAAYG
ncbi:MAG: ComEA family DNA-binding protein, partial [Candidatus Latescibacterota bacterium]